MTRPVIPTDSTPKPTAPPLKNFTDGLTNRDSYSEPTINKTKKGKKAKASGKKNKKLTTQQACEKVLKKAKSFTKSRDHDLTPSEPAKSTTKEYVGNALVHSANWEILRKNLHSPSLYFDSLQELQLFHIDQAQKDFNFMQSAWETYWRWSMPYKPKAFHSTLGLQNSRQSSKNHGLANYPNYYPSVSPTALGEVATPLFFGAFFTRKCAESLNQWTDYQQRIIALNNEYLTQWQTWQNQTRQRFFSTDTMSLENSKDTLNNSEAKDHNKWPHSQNYLWYGHRITTH